MDETGRATTETFVRRHNTTIESIVNTLYWVIIALLLAFIFRTFIMEAFQIPTGSMAETLCGAHHHLRCRVCGYKYDLGSDGLTLGNPKCPSCKFAPKERIRKRSSNGDRILVLKCIYEFVQPRRWDVVVFKYPNDPSDNYIKRMIALPGETVEIIDGDIYINGEISRKPRKVQDELWTCVYDNDYARMSLADSDGDPAIEGALDVWRCPFANSEGSLWAINSSGSRKFSLRGVGEKVHGLVYRPDSNKDFVGQYAYNHSTGYKHMPVCSDLMVRGYVVNDGDVGHVGIGLRKYGSIYRGRVEFDGSMVIERTFDGKTVELAQGSVDTAVTGKGKEFSFANIDHKLILVFGAERLVYDLGANADSAGPIERDSLGKVVHGEGGMVEIFGSGKMDVYHTRVYRDIHYIGESDILRPRLDKPFTIGADEYFVCGDNSPSSFDSRLWPTEGRGNNGAVYRTGIVPRDYLVGKAFFLYWGDAFRPFENMLPLIPNLSEMKFIYGGSDAVY